MSHDTATPTYAELKAGFEPLPCAGEPIVDIDEFARFAEEAWLGHGERELRIERDLPIMALGLAGEAGEATEHVKKFIRDGRIDRAALRKELGDVAYYLVRMCDFWGFKPSEVLGENRAKLLDRKARGVLRGQGDER